MVPVASKWAETMLQAYYHTNLPLNANLPMPFILIRKPIQKLKKWARQTFSALRAITNSSRHFRHPFCQVSPNTHCSIWQKNA